MRLLNNSSAPHQILCELENSGLEWKRVGDTTPIHDAITYLTNNADRMDYAAARAAGLHIGSGTVEATCKSLVQVRMCRSERPPVMASATRALAITQSRTFDDPVCSFVVTWVLRGLSL